MVQERDTLTFRVAAFQRGDFSDAIDIGRSSLVMIDRISVLDVDFKDDLVTNILGIVANSYFELDDVSNAIAWHEKDLKFCRKRSVYNEQVQFLLLQQNNFQFICFLVTWRTVSLELLEILDGEAGKGLTASFSYRNPPVASKRSRALRTSATS